MDQSPKLTRLETEKKELSDAEYIERSRVFADEYLGLLNGEVNTDFQVQVAEKVLDEFSPLFEKTKNLENKALSSYAVQGYRTSLNTLYGQHNLTPPFSEEAPSDDQLAHVLRAEKGPFGMPILYTDGFNEDLFADDTISFASADLMIQNGLIPIAVVYENYNPPEKQQVVAHETSHMVFALLRRTGIIPNPEGEGITIAGQTTAFELARDEAIAQMAADQKSGIHPNVIERMKKQGYAETELVAYRNAMQSFNKSIADKAGLKFSDGILGVAMAKNFADLSDHMIRMNSIATQYSE